MERMFGMSIELLAEPSRRKGFQKDSSLPEERFGVRFLNHTARPSFWEQSPYKITHSPILPSRVSTSSRPPKNPPKRGELQTLRNAVPIRTPELWLVSVDINIDIKTMI